MFKKQIKKCLMAGLVLTATASVNAGSINESFDFGLPAGTATGPASAFFPGDTYNDFDLPGTPGTIGVFNAPPGPQLMGGGPSGNFLRIMQDAGSNHNAVASDRSELAPFQTYTASWEFRMQDEPGHTGCCGNRADGYGVAVLNVQDYAASGTPFPTSGAWESPTFANSIGLGFRIFSCCPGPEENSVTLSYNGGTISYNNIPAGTLHLNNDTFIRANLSVTEVAGGLNVSLDLIDDVYDARGDIASTFVPVFTDVFIAGAAGYHPRLAIGGRTGGAFTSLDIDNVSATQTYDTAAYGDGSGKLLLTPGTGGQLGSFAFTDQDAGMPVRAFSASFDFMMPEASRPGADGLSMSFSRLGDVAGTGEEGTATGLAIGIDNYFNGGEDPDDNHIQVRMDGVLVANLSEGDILGLVGLDLHDGKMHNLRAVMTDGYLELFVTPNGGFESQIYGDVIPGWAAYAGQFVFSGRTGGLQQDNVIENFRADTTAIPEPASLALIGLGLAGLAGARRRNR